MPTDTKVFLDDARYLLAGRQDRFDLRAHQHAELVEGVEIERVAGGDTYDAVVAIDRDHAIAVNDLRGCTLEQFGINAHLAEVDQRDRELLAIDLQVVALVNDSQTSQTMLDALGRLAGGPSLLELCGCDDPSFE